MGLFAFRRRRSERGAGGLRPLEGTDDRGAVVVEEIEAFLSGRLADHHARTDGCLPAWVIVNTIAHGNLAQVVDRVTPPEEGWRAHPSIVLWTSAERSLALRLLRAGPTPDELRQLQSTVLVPLELELLERSTARAASLSEVISATNTALDEHLLDR